MYAVLGCVAWVSGHNRLRSDRISVGVAVLTFVDSSAFFVLALPNLPSRVSWAW